ncbi:MAG: AEC family transporter [Rhodocyclaceae bacterium]|nr:AEC family transporter [Rhodocyclaceae bacterium]
MLLRIVSIIFPLFAIVLAGWVYGRRFKPDMAFANQLNMDVFIPALVFATLAGHRFDLVTYWALAVGAAAVVLGSGLAAWPLARLMKVETKTFLPPMMFNNSGNMGLPLAVLAFGEAALPAAVVLFLVENLLHFSLGAWMLDHRTRLSTVWRMPVMLAALAGLGVSASGLALWPPLLTAIRMLGDISIPLLLFSLGVRLAAASFHAWGIGVAGAIARPLLGMLIAWGAGWALDLSPLHRDMLLVFGALPPAVLNYVFAERYRQEPDKVASIVMVGNVASVLFISVALAIVL